MASATPCEEDEGIRLSSRMLFCLVSVSDRDKIWVCPPLHQPKLFLLHSLRSTSLHYGKKQYPPLNKPSFYRSVRRVHPYPVLPISLSSNPLLLLLLLVDPPTSWDTENGCITSVPSRLTYTLPIRINEEEREMESPSSSQNHYPPGGKPFPQRVRSPPLPSEHYALNLKGAALFMSSTDKSGLLDDLELDGGGPGRGLRLACLDGV